MRPFLPSGEISSRRFFIDYVLLPQYVTHESVPSPLLLHLESHDIRQIAHEHGNTVRRPPEHLGRSKVDPGAPVKTADELVVKPVQFLLRHSMGDENEVQAVHGGPVLGEFAELPD